MNAPSKTRLAERLEHAKSIREAHAALESEIDLFNSRVDELKADVEAALSDLNEALISADEWLDGVRADMDGHFDEMSEGWQESEKGQAYLEWKDQFFGHGDRIKVEFPDAMTVPECDAADEIEALPEAP
jgi:chromosome segregation ATPase